MVSNTVISANNLSVTSYQHTTYPEPSFGGRVVRYNVVVGPYYLTCLKTCIAQSEIW
jgi:hypothetical protein